jgi:hypothetical protein
LATDRLFLGPELDISHGKVLDAAIGGDAATSRFNQLCIEPNFPQLFLTASLICCSSSFVDAPSPALLNSYCALLKFIFHEE